MRTCTPSEFLTRWPESLRPVALPEGALKLPKGCRRLLTEFGLPRELSICCYNDLTLRFSGSATPLAAIWERDLGRGLQLMAQDHKPGELPGEWTRFWHLADLECNQGGGWVCIEEGTGRLVVIDLNLRSPVYLLSSSVRNFYTTLAHFLAWSEKTGGSAAETARLRDSLLKQHCIPPEELTPFWMDFVVATLDGDPKDLVVALGHKSAEPGAAANGGGM
jgi:hypothetical protein